jgi:hypothetical protein
MKKNEGRAECRRLYDTASEIVETVSVKLSRMPEPRSSRRYRVMMVSIIK